MSRFWSAAQDSDSESGSSDHEVAKKIQPGAKFGAAYDSDTGTSDDYFDILLIIDENWYISQNRKMKSAL